MRKIPRLYSTRQVARMVGVQTATIRGMIRNGRLIGFQWVDGRYVIQEDFRVAHGGVMQAGIDLPPELLADEPEKVIENAGGRERLSWEKRNKLRLRGYDRVTQGYGVRELERLTGVSHVTQAKIKKGEAVMATVAWKLARGLDIEVEELLKP